MASLAIASANRTASRKAWEMVAFGVIGTMCGVIPVLLINIGFFMKPLAESFGWSRAAIVMSLSIGALMMAVANPIAGRLIDRQGVRRVLIWSQLLYGLSIALFPLLIGALGIYGLYVGFALASGLGGGSSIIAFVRLLSGWFSGTMLKSRGFALGCSAAGVPLGASIIGPFAIYLITHFGWAGGFYGLALVPLLVGLPISIFFIREAPADHAAIEADHVPGAGLPGATIGEAARTGHFWIMIAMVLLISSCTQGLSIHIAPFLSDVGMTPSGLATITAISGMLAIVARVGAGYLFDRYFAPRVALAIFALPLAAAAMMASVPSFQIAVIGSVLLALGQGAESDFIGYLVGRYFGLRQYGRIFGTIYGTFMLGIAIGPYLFGMAYDSWGDYRVPFGAAAVGLTILCVLLALLPRFPAEHSWKKPAPALQ